MKKWERLKRNYLKRLKRVILNGFSICSAICICLSVLFSALLYPCCVLASETETSETQEDTVNMDNWITVAKENFFNWVLLNVGITGSALSEKVSVFKTEIESYLTAQNLFIDCGDSCSVPTCLDAYTLSVLRTLIKEILNEQQPYFYLESNPDYGTIYEKKFFTVDYKYPYIATLIRTKLTKYKWCAVNGQTGIFVDMSDFKYCYIDSSNKLRFVDKDLNLSYCVYTVASNIIESDVTQYLKDNDVTVSNSIVESLFNERFNNGRSDNINMYLDCTGNAPHLRVTNTDGSYYLLNYPFAGNNLIVFKSQSDLNLYLLNGADYYTTTNYNNNDYSDTYISNENINNYTNENINNIYNIIKGNDEDCLTAEELQKLIDETIVNGINELNGTIGEVGETLEETNGLLTKIYNKLCDIFGSIESLYDFLVNGEMETKKEEFNSETGLWGQLYSAESIAMMLNMFLYGCTVTETTTYVATSGEETTEEIIEVTDTLGSLRDEFVEYSDEVLANRPGANTRQYSGVLGLLANHFPFSLPWDIYDIFTSFVAEKETPKWSVDFYVSALDETFVIDIDLSKFEKLSTISRSLLSLLALYSCVLLWQKQLKAKG